MIYLTRSIFVSFLLILLSVCGASARTVEVNFEKKVIYTDSLALPKNTTVETLLSMLPELLQRPDEYVLSNYEVQVEEVSMGEAADAVLMVMQLADIERIEVKNSATASDLNNGESGSIGIFLRPLAAQRLGLSGSASVGVASDMSFMPNLLMNYRGDKVSVRGMAFGEMMNATVKSNMSPPNPWDSQTNEYYREQLARATIYYKPGSRDDLRLTLMESTYYDRNELTFSDFTDRHYLDYFNRTTKDWTTQLMANMQYVHKFTSKRYLKAKGQYLHKPKENWSLIEDSGQENDSYLTEDKWQGSIELNDKYALPQGKGTFAYKVGSKAALSDKKKHSDISIAGIEQSSSDKTEQVRELTPFVEMSLIYGPLRLKAGAEYLSSSADNMSDWTGHMVLALQMHRDHRLRMLMNRQTKNPQLVSQDVGGDYFGEFAWGKHRLTTNACVSYCTTSWKSGLTHYIFTNLMAVYQYDIFFLSLTGNHYRKELNREEGKHGFYTYYNLSLMPSLNLQNGWRTSLNLRYFSPVSEELEEQGRCLTLQANMGKSWRAWDVYCYGRVPLTGRAETRFAETGKVYTYDMSPTLVGGGVSYRF